MTGVVRREGAATGLIVDVVDQDGKWRYLEDLPGPVLLTESDVLRAAALLRGARWVSVQLQQPVEAVRAALALAGETGAKVVLDGVPAEDADAVLAEADVLGADAHEAELLTGASIDGPDEALRAGRELLERGVVDTTGAGDAFVAGLITALARAEPPGRAARLAGAAAAATVRHAGGRPDLAGGSLDRYLAMAEGGGVSA